MNTHFQQAGFSLIEVMVAILILGIALVGFTHAITTALASSKDSEQQTVAALFAAGRIETLRAENDLENGETDGNCGPGLEAYQWKQTISNASIDGLFDVDVVIETAKNHQMIYELQTQLFEPSDNSGTPGDKSKKPSGGAS